MNTINRKASLLLSFATKHKRAKRCFTRYNFLAIFNVVAEMWLVLSQQKKHNLLLKTALNNVLLPTLFNVVNNIVQHC